MALLKKVHPEWMPQEKQDLQVGEVLDFPGPYEALVRQGVAVLVDGKGNEVELPGQLFECPICFEKVEGLTNFINHVSTHQPKPAEKTEESKEVKVEAEVVGEDSEKEEAPKDDARAKRLAALEKARAARKAKK